MIPTITSFAEALARGDSSFTTLHGIRYDAGSRGHEISRTSMFAKAPVSIDGVPYLLCVPLTDRAAAEAERAAEEIRRSRCTFLSEYRILHAEMEFRNSTGRNCRCDVLLHRLPQGESLDTAVTHVPTRRLKQALDLLAAQMLATGFVHGNLKPANLIFGDDGMLHPIRYGHARTGAPAGEVEAEIEAIERYIDRHHHIPDMDEEMFDGKVLPTGSRTDEFDEIDPPHDMMRRIRIGNLYGYADAEGRTAIEPQFTYAENFCENRAVVETADGAGVIDRTGRRIVETRYDMAERDEESGCFIARDGEEWFMFDYFGHEKSHYGNEKAKAYEYGKC